MPLFHHFIAAAVFLTTAAGAGAAISWVSAFRQVECGPALRAPPGEFADFNESLAGMVQQPGEQPRNAGTASQISLLRPGSITITSRISGDALRGSSLFIITFDLDEGAAFTLTGSISLLGTAGFACVSLVNLANADTPLVHEVIFTPPLALETRPFNYSGIMEPGRYTMEAMIYGGGDNQFTQGGIDVAFYAPEPGGILPAAGLLLLLRRRQPVRHFAGRRRALRE